MTGRALAAVAVMWIAACGARQSGSGDSRIEQTFSASGVARVELRASNATGAQVAESEGPEIRVTGTARGGAKSTREGQRQVPATEWGLGFVSKRHRDTLIISTENEVSDMERRYTVEDLVIAVPEGVEVQLVTRSLTGSRAPDLSIGDE